jgi:NADP-dependent 3-hydroxy acid dehydrogenase YdfG
MTQSVRSKVAVVSGASRGIGKAICEQFVRAGIETYAIASSEDVHRLQGVHSRQCDLRDEVSVTKVIAEIIETKGQIDILINNAGVGYFADLEQYTSEQFRHMFDVNVYGLFLLTKCVVPHMKEARDGIILNIASDVSRRTFAGGSLYVASKYAVQGLSGCLAQEVRSFGVRVGTINPGIVDTYFAGATQGSPEKSEFLQADQLAELVMYVVNAPKSVNFDEIVVHPMAQEYGLS